MKNKNYSDMGLGYTIGVIIFGIALLVLVVVGTNSCSASDWNGGICPGCNVRYELRGAAGDLHLKYYVCPECGKEVKRY